MIQKLLSVKDIEKGNMPTPSFGIPDTKQIGGRNYFLFDFCFTQEEARKEAAELRACKDHWFVRVVPAGEGYHVWRR